MNRSDEDDLVNYFSANVKAKKEPPCPCVVDCVDILDDSDEDENDLCSTSGGDFASQLLNSLRLRKRSGPEIKPKADPRDSPTVEIVKLPPNEGQLPNKTTKSGKTVRESVILLKKGNKPNELARCRVVPTSTTPEAGQNASRDSEEADQFDENGKKMTKNAILARENRKRKKKYVEALENDVEALTAENTALKRKVSGMEETIDSLTKDVHYLKGVLANQSTLSALLKNIQNTPGVSFSCSIDSPPSGDAPESRQTGTKKRGNDSEDDEKEEIKRPESASGSGAPAAKVPRLDHAYNRPATQARRSRSTGVQKASEKLSNFDSQKENVDSHKREKLSLNDACGVCLHVSKGNVSLEFCAKCSGNAARGCSKDLKTDGN